MGLAGIVVGGIVFVVGVFLFAGNVIGFFPTVPLAGYLTMLAGGAIFAWGKRKATEEQAGTTQASDDYPPQR